jgi:hypothetical protein
VPAGTTVTLTATSNGQPVTPTWQVNGATGGDLVHGTISTTGNYTAPLSPPPGGSVTITAISGSNSGTAAATIVFSNKSLTADGNAGLYAFSYSGSDANFAPLAVAGSFQTDGNGNITAGMEDFNDGSSSTGPITEAFTGSYVVGPDGRASAQLGSGGAIWQFTLISNQHALLIRFDTVGTGSGTIDLQTPGDFASSITQGSYAFSLSGVDANGSPLTFAGRFPADGVSAIPSGVEDVNDSGTSTNGDPDKTLLGTYQLDPTYGPSFGRGSITFNNSLATTDTTFPAGFPTAFTFAFYIVDKTHLKIVETDITSGAILSGDIFSAPNQPGSGFTASILSGKYAFTVGGASQNGPYAAAGVFTSNGSTSSSGSITSGVLDFNDSGSNIGLKQSITGTYSVDPSLGRISMQLTFGQVTQNFAGYTTSSGSVLLIELDKNPASASGVAYPQTFSSAAQGSFALNLSGVASQVGVEQDVTGQLAINSTTLYGTLDINNFQDKGLSQGLEIQSGSTLVSPDSNGRGTLTLQTTQATFPLAYYLVDNNTVLLFETDSSRVMVGTLMKQF